MDNYQAGDRVRIKDRPDWPMPKGYKLANQEGRVFHVFEEGYVTVLLDENAAGIDARIPLGFRADAIEKI